MTANDRARATELQLLRAELRVNAGEFEVRANALEAKGFHGAATEARDIAAALRWRATMMAGAATFQARVLPWMLEAFGLATLNNIQERGDRLLEEVLELLQAHGYDSTRVATLRDYTFARPVGVPAQEVGGVMLTLAAFAIAAGIDMHVAGEAELERVWNCMDTIRAKQAAKRDLHSPLPGAAAIAAEAAS